MEKRASSFFKDTTLNDSPPYDLVFLNHPDKTELERLILKRHLHNDSLVVVDAINKYPRAWKSCCAIQDITVSIDFYRCGTLFLRREQAKQHFIIRL